MILTDLLPYTFLLLMVLVALLMDKRIAEIFLFIIFFIFSGFRYGVGWDFYNYVNIIEFGGWRIEKLELLVRLLAAFCEKMGFTQFFFVATSFVILLFHFLTYAKESKNPVISVFVFLCIPTFFLNSMVLIRYFLAASSVFLSCHFAYKKQYIPYFLFLFIAVLFHRAAVFGALTVPFVLFRIRFKMGVNLTIFFSCFAIGVIIGSFSFFSSLFGFLSDSYLFGDLFESGEQYVQDTGNANFSKTPYVFALINLINVFSFRDVFNSQDKSKQQLGHYITMYNIGCSLMFLFSFNAIFSNRLSLMFTLFLTLIIPYYKKFSIGQIAIFAICIFVFYYELTIDASHPLFFGRQNCWLPYRLNLTSY